MPGENGNGLGHYITDERYVVRISGVTAVTAEAMKEVARCQFAVPAQEATKQSAELTKREWINRGTTAVCVLAALLTLYLKPEAGRWVAAIVGILAAGATAERAIEKYLPKKKGPSAEIERRSGDGDEKEN